MNLAYRYLEKTEFESYEDFCENLKIKVPGNFNFAYDIMDEYAKLEPERLALIWCNDHDEERFISFAEMKKYTDKAANVFKKAGIKKGDKVMLILRRRYEFYFALLGLTKLGAIVIPSTDQLTEKDIIYRNNAAKIKLIVAYNRPDIIRHVEGSLAESPTVEQLMLVGGSKEGWLDFDKMMAEASEEWTRPTGEEGTQNNDIMLIYFTSGTTSMPKMTVHDFTYPLGHIITAKYWQKIIDGGIHLTVADSGWAKFAWGKLYGQWICGAIMFMYDMERFDADHLLKKLEKYRIATFCAPPTVYRFMLQQDLDRYDLSSLVHLFGKIFFHVKNKTNTIVSYGFNRVRNRIQNFYVGIIGKDVRHQISNLRSVGGLRQSNRNVFHDVFFHLGDSAAHQRENQRHQDDGNQNVRDQGSFVPGHILNFFRKNNPYVLQTHIFSPTNFINTSSRLLSLYLAVN